MLQTFEADIFKITGEKQFEKLALEIFHFQVEKNQVYSDYIQKLGINPSHIYSLVKIPFLPIELFKHHHIFCGPENPEIVFESSGTTGMERSKHHVAKLSLYEYSFRSCFRRFYGDPSNMCILALLPSYLERDNSSLVYMMNDLIQKSSHPDSGFYLNNLSDLSNILTERIEDRQASVLLGVSFALLDLAEKYPMALSDNITIIETGGMKGKRKELTREELHRILREAFQITEVHSEYGMTEMLSQAYSQGSNTFQSPPWMKVLCRDMYDPLTNIGSGQSGGINIIDLANLYSCSFIATSDLGRVFPDGSFEVSGRFDQAGIRGCNLMVE